MSVAVEPDTQNKSTSGDHRVAHLVLKQDWPRALCGATVTDNFGVRAPAMDRCVQCLKIANARGLGRPGWAN